MLVENLAEIEANVDTLIQAIHTGASDSVAYADLVKAGAIFYPYLVGDFIAFAPSRFIGYKDNSIENHKSLIATGVAHGSYTSAVINRILGYEAVEDEELEGHFHNYCLKIGVQPHSKRHKFWKGDRIARTLLLNASAIDDLDPPLVGNALPHRAAYSGTLIVRDERVRQQVIQRASGRCEHCDELGFKKADGSHYVEAHHIISLAKQGPDTLENVIALCPNHHRQAHFGQGWEQFEAELKARLTVLRSK